MSEPTKIGDLITPVSPRPAPKYRKTVMELIQISGISHRPYSSAWAMAQEVYSLAEQLDVSPIYILWRLKDARNKRAYLNALRRKMVRENDMESFYGWCRRIEGG